MTPIETHTLPSTNLTLEIHHDSDPLNPRKEYDNLGTMVCFHRRYDLGDKHDFTDPEDFFDNLVHEALSPEERDRRYRVQNLIDRIPAYFDHKGRWVPKPTHIDRHASLVQDLDRLRDTALNRYIILPVYLYDHSGLSISTRSFSCPWDSGQGGWIYMTLTEAQANWPNDPDPIEAATRCLKAEIDEYDLYLTGDAWGYVVTDTVGDELASCWGYLGIESAREDGLAELRALAESLPQQHELSL